MDKVFLLVYLILIVKAVADNKIGLEECALNDVTDNLSQVKFRKKFESSSGFGLWNILKNEYGHFLHNMSENNLIQMCYCASTKLYSFKEEKSTIKYENYFMFWRRLPYIGWFFHFIILVNAGVKCSIPNGPSFFLVETENYYKAPKTRDLFVLEINENDLKDPSVAPKKGRLTKIKYPTGQFKAFIPKVDLTEVVNEDLGTDKTFCW